MLRGDDLGGRAGWSALKAIPYLFSNWSERRPVECVPWTGDCLREWEPSDNSFVCNVVTPVRGSQWGSLFRALCLRSETRDRAAPWCEQRTRCGDFISLGWLGVPHSRYPQPSWLDIRSGFIVPNNRARLVQNKEDRAIIMKALGMETSKESPSPAELETLLFALHAWEGGFARERSSDGEEGGRAPKVELRLTDPIYKQVKQRLKTGQTSSVEELTPSEDLQIPFMEEARWISEGLDRDAECSWFPETAEETSAWKYKRLSGDALMFNYSDEENATEEEDDATTFYDSEDDYRSDLCFERQRA